MAAVLQMHAQVQWRDNEDEREMNGGKKETTALGSKKPLRWKLML